MLETLEKLRGVGEEVIATCSWNIYTGILIAIGASSNLAISLLSLDA